LAVNVICKKRAGEFGHSGGVSKKAEGVIRV
jgi:hypothetical protein